MKKIAISQRVIPVEKGALRDGLEQDYVTYYKKFGMLLIPISNADKDVESTLRALDVEGIILSGGNDINPALYNETPQTQAFYASDRDETEKALLVFAIKNKIPVFCECRGMQFLNIYFGGKLLQSIDKQHPEAIKHVGFQHDIFIIDKEFYSFLGKEIFKVNSYHQQGFTKMQLSSNLRAFAEAKDGIIEGIYHPELPIIGIMWHPERAGCDNELNNLIISKYLSLFSKSE